MMNSAVLNTTSTDLQSPTEISSNELRFSRNRKGTSLIEVVIVISIASVLLSMSVTMIASLMRAQGRVTDSVRQTLVLSRIRRQLQQDVHAATSVTTNTEGKVVLTLPDNQAVVFSALDHVLNRKQTTGADPNGTGNEGTGNEAYRLAIGSTVQIKVIDLNDYKLVRFITERPIGNRPTTAEGPNVIIHRTQTVELEAVVGRDNRFTGSNTSP